MEHLGYYSLWEAKLVQPLGEILTVSPKLNVCTHYEPDILLIYKQSYIY